MYKQCHWFCLAVLLCSSASQVCDVASPLLNLMLRYLVQSQTVCIWIQIQSGIHVAGRPHDPIVPHIRTDISDDGTHGGGVMQLQRSSSLASGTTSPHQCPSHPCPIQPQKGPQQPHQSLCQLQPCRLMLHMHHHHTGTCIRTRIPMTGPAQTH